MNRPPGAEHLTPALTDILPGSESSTASLKAQINFSRVRTARGSWLSIMERCVPY